MRESRILYKIKSLEKMILRSFIDDSDSVEQLAVHPTPTQMQIIEYILEHDNKCIYQKDFEEVLNLRRATVSGVLQTMEKNGLLERVSYSEDARVKCIILNDKARRIFSKNKEKMEELENIVTKDISSDKLLIFSEVLDMMKDNLKNNNIK